MEKKTIRALYLLNTMIEKCVSCPLHKNGHIKPYWTGDSSYILIGDNIENNKLLWKLMSEQGFTKEQFLILGNVNCNNNIPYLSVKNELQHCKKWVDLYINTMMPLRGILFGNYLKENGSLELKITYKINAPVIPIVKSINPKFASYSSEGIKLLEESILKFKMM